MSDGPSEEFKTGLPPPESEKGDINKGKHDLIGGIYLQDKEAKATTSADVIQATNARKELGLMVNESINTILPTDLQEAESKGVSLDRLRARVRFSNEYTHAEQDQVLRDIQHIAAIQMQRHHAEDEMSWEKYLHNKKGDIINEARRNLSENEKGLITRTLDQVRKKLNAMGLDEEASRIPTTDQIDYRFLPFTSDNMAIGAFVDSYSGLMALYFAQGEGFDSLENQVTLAHECSHEINKVTFVKRRDFWGIKEWDDVARTETGEYPEGSGRPYVINQIGFDRNPRQKYIETENGTEPARGRDIYDEPLSELFSLYVLDNPEAIVQSSTYVRDRVPFMMAFLESYAQRRGIEPVVAFEQIFRAKTRGDYSFMGELATVMGKETMMLMNNYFHERDQDSTAINDTNLLAIARAGGFESNYNALRQTLERGESISYPGIQGKIRLSKNQ